MSDRFIGYKCVTPNGLPEEEQLKENNLNEVLVDYCDNENKDKPMFEKVIRRASKGGFVFVQNMNILADNIIDLEKTIKRILETEAVLFFVKECCTLDDDSLDMSCIFTIKTIENLAEFERNIT